MYVGIASDHRGVALRRLLTDWLEANGHAVWDAGPHDTVRVDYPDFAGQVARRVAAGTLDRGVLICGTGIGMAIAANKWAGVRAAPIDHRRTAEMSRRHNDINVVCYGADLLEPEQAIDYLRIFLETPFDGGRHAARIAMLEPVDGHRTGEAGEVGKPGGLGRPVSS